MALAVPTVERPNHGNSFSVGCPYGEICAFLALDGSLMRTELVVKPDVAAFVKQIEIVIAEQRHRRVPRRLQPFFRSAPYLAGHGGANSAARCRLQEHFAGVPLPRGLPNSQARYSPY